jgi:aspartyl-tRNA(Asn)/glutamyl-tRNA(Gln) amidotransferase subunit A
MSIMDLSLAQAAAALAAGTLSSLELVDAALARAQAVNPQLNAFLRLDADSARAQARAADAERARGYRRGPLHGVPMAHKDMFFRAGVASSCGTHVKLPLPTTTATVLSRLDAAGALQFGVLNMAAFAVGPTGHNAAVGHCRNPWNTERISGGSSSGSGASVAARASFAALGSDTAGSIRIPSALCGITGLKPTQGRVSRAGAMPFSFTLDTIGPLARSAYDCAMMMNAIAGPDAADTTSAQVDTPDYLHRIGQPVQGLRVGVPMNYFTEGIAPEVDRVLQDSLSALRELGCMIVPVDIPDLAAADAAAGMIISCEGAALHAALMQEQGELYGTQMKARLERGFAIPAPRYLDALRYRNVAAVQFIDAVFSKVDVLHTPLIPINTPEIATSDVTSGAAMDTLITQLTRFTRPFNYLGLPALALPVGCAGDGMPLSMQLVGRPFSEDLLLRLGHAFQCATDWHVRAPPAA